MNSNLRRTISDRRKVLIAVTLLTILTIVIVETITIGATRHQLMQRTDDSLRRKAATGRVATDSLTPEVLAGLSKISRILDPESSVTVLDRTGKVFYELPARTSGTPRAAPRLPRRAVLQSQIGKPFSVPGTGGVRQFRVMVGRLRPTITIVYATPLTAIDATISDLTREAVLLGVVAVILLGLILWRLLTAATRPINSMIDVAARIGDGDFSARVEPDFIQGDAARLGIALNQMVARIERAFAETSASEATLRRFVADASHELRTPLTSIRGYAQLLRMGAAGNEAETALTRIDSEAARMALLVDDLLLLARLDQGRPLEREPVDVSVLARDIADDARMLEPHRPISVDVPAGAAIVLGDAGRLQQLVANLLANVRKHTGPYTPCALAVETTDTEVLVTVADHGPGMTETDAARAFDRFYRADTSRSRDSGGSGLGLAIVKAIVEAHAGTIELTTSTGEGTTVQVRLPRAVRTDPSPIGSVVREHELGELLAE